MALLQNIPKGSKILVSTSGGRSSAMMSIMFNKLYSKDYEIMHVFANTSREEEETLIFIDKIQKHFGINIVWIESKVFHGERRASGFSETSFMHSERNGLVFEEVIKKYGIPNNKFKHCTRELKSNPIKAYARFVGFGEYGKDYYTAIGYRADEQKRIKSNKLTTDKHIYLLNDAGIKKSDVALFWSQQPFDLQLKDYEGNCKLCYKKSKRKLLTQLVEHPEHRFWVEDMEEKYERFTPETHRQIASPYRFYRDNDSIFDLLDETFLPFEKAIDKSTDKTGATFSFNADMDYEDSDCGNSCEPFSIENMEDEI